MTLKEASRRYSGLVTRALQAAKAGDWELCLALDKESHEYALFIIQQVQEGVDILEDMEVRLYLAEVLACHKEIKPLAEMHRDVIKRELSLIMVTDKLQKLYG